MKIFAVVYIAMLFSSTFLLMIKENRKKEGKKKFYGIWYYIYHFFGRGIVSIKDK